MSTTERLFAESLQKTEDWLHQLAELGRFESPAQAYSALHAVLHALRDRLTVDEAAQLGAQLPLLIRGVYYEGWKPALLPSHQRSKFEFLSRIRGRMGDCDVDPQAVCRAVFQLLERHIGAGEIDSVRHMLPDRLRELWPAPTSHRW
ncbi:MAG: DUF2267 domain-containing protein [Phycisphaerales bacterium]